MAAAISHSNKKPGADGQYNHSILVRQARICRINLVPRFRHSSYIWSIGCNTVAHLTPPLSLAMDLLKNLQNLHLSDDKKSTEHHAPTPPPTAAATTGHSAPKHENLLNKIGDVLGGDHKSAPAPVVAAPPPKEDSLFDKLGEALGGSKHTAAPPAPKKEENLLDKIGDKLTGHKTPPPPPKEENLLNKLTNVISGKKEEPPKPHSVADKINSALGGGAKGEANEGKLDKGIPSLFLIPTQHFLSR